MKVFVFVVTMVSLVLMGVYLPWLVRRFIDKFNLLYWVKVLIQVLVTFIAMLLVMMLMSYYCMDGEIVVTIPIVGVLVALYAVFIDYAR